MAKVIVACGSGVATSQTVASKVEGMLKKAHVKAEVEAVDIKSLEQFIKSADVYISIVRTKTKIDIPTINGIAFLTGMGEDEEFQKLVDAIHAADARKIHR